MELYTSRLLFGTRRAVRLTKGKDKVTAAARTSRIFVQQSGADESWR